MISLVIVERSSNMKCKQQKQLTTIDERHHASIEHLSKEMPILGIERWTAR